MFTIHKCMHIIKIMTLGVTISLHIPKKKKRSTKCQTPTHFCVVQHKTYIFDFMYATRSRVNQIINIQSVRRTVCMGSWDGSFQKFSLGATLCLSGQFVCSVAKWTRTKINIVTATTTTKKTSHNLDK
jgi:hypothetical protein